MPVYSLKTTGLILNNRRYIRLQQIGILKTADLQVNNRTIGYTLKVHLLYKACNNLRNLEDTTTRAWSTGKRYTQHQNRFCW